MLDLDHYGYSVASEWPGFSAMSTQLLLLRTRRPIMPGGDTAKCVPRPAPARRVIRRDNHDALERAHAHAVTCTAACP
jgi:hypothetical protein